MIKIDFFRFLFIAFFSISIGCDSPKVEEEKPIIDLQILTDDVTEL